MRIPHPNRDSNKACFGVRERQRDRHVVAGALHGKHDLLFLSGKLSGVRAKLLHDNTVREAGNHANQAK